MFDCLKQDTVIGQPKPYIKQRLWITRTCTSACLLIFTPDSPGTSVIKIDDAIYLNNTANCPLLIRANREFLETEKKLSAIASFENWSTETKLESQKFGRSLSEAQDVATSRRRETRQEKDYTSMTVAVANLITLTKIITINYSTITVSIRVK